MGAQSTAPSCTPPTPIPPASQDNFEQLHGRLVALESGRDPKLSSFAPLVELRELENHLMVRIRLQVNGGAGGRVKDQSSSCAFLYKRIGPYPNRQLNLQVQVRHRRVGPKPGDARNHIFSYDRHSRPYVYEPL